MKLSHLILRSETAKAIQQKLALSKNQLIYKDSLNVESYLLSILAIVDFCNVKILFV